MKKFKAISNKLKEEIEAEVKMMLHASRDCMRNRNEYDSKKTPFVAWDGYYGEAFGVMRGLKVLGYGGFGSVNLHGLRDSNTKDRASQQEHNLSFWFREIESKVLAEENFEGNHQCDYCLEKFRKDDVRKKQC